MSNSLRLSSFSDLWFPSSDLSLSEMNLLQRLSSNLWHRVEGLLKPNLAQTSSPQIDSLYDRIISTAKRDSSLSIVPVLDQWHAEHGFGVCKLRKCVKELRKNGDYENALQVSDWMTNQKGFQLSSKDINIRLHLISKLHGLEKADEYFDSIAKSNAGMKTYNALLNFYAETNQMEKADAVFQNMKDMGSVNIRVAYRTMGHLYVKKGKHVKKDLLSREMDEKHISINVFTFNKRLQAYVDCSNIEGMEKVIKYMSPQIEMNFDSYILAAKGYLKARRFDKAMAMLKRSEKLIKDKFRITSYLTLIGLYADIGDKACVYRVWDLYNQTGMVSNPGYSYMIFALLKLDDFDGAEKIYEERESGKKEFNIRIPKAMIFVCSKKGSLEKAEAYMNKILEKGMKPYSASWGHMAIGYLEQGQMKKGIASMKKALSTPTVDSIKKGIPILEQVWMPRLGISEKCLMYLKDQGDKEAADELLKMINKHCHLSTDEYTRLSSCVKD